MWALYLASVVCAYIDLADIDGDGDVDVVTVVDDKIAWLENLGSGTCFHQKMIAVERPDSESTVRIFDMDGDGHPDVLTNQAWYKNRGGTCDGGFCGFCGPHAVPKPTDGALGYIRPMDVDGDGDLDVLASWYAPWNLSPPSSLLDKIVWFENLGSGSDEMFGEMQVVSEKPVGLSGLHFADFNADGRMDVVASWRPGGTTPRDAEHVIAWYPNLGGGLWGPQEIVAQAPMGPNKLGKMPAGVRAADLNGDGLPDLLFYATGIARAQCGAWSEVGKESPQCSEINWIENKGNGAWADPKTISWATEDEMRGVNSVYAKDLDGDGDLDVLATTWVNEQVAWHENNGDGTFKPHEVVTTNVDHTGWVLTGDMDGDGDLDVVCLDVSEHETPCEKAQKCTMAHPPACCFSKRPVWFENVAGHDATPSVDMSRFGEHQMLACETAPDDGNGHGELAVACSTDDVVDTSMEDSVAGGAIWLPVVLLGIV